MFKYLFAVILILITIIVFFVQSPSINQRRHIDVDRRNDNQFQHIDNNQRQHVDNNQHNDRTIRIVLPFNTGTRTRFQQLLFDHHLLIVNEFVDRIRQEIEIVQQPQTREEDQPIGEFIDQIKIQRNDTQNVHDSMVVKNAKSIIEKISENCDKNIPLDVIRTGIIQRYAVSPHIYSVLNVLDKFTNDQTNFGVSDTQVLSLVWSRAECTKNSKSTEVIRENLFIALSECEENGIVVCATGRILKVLSSLTLVDYDEETWNLTSYDQRRNEILNRTKNIISDCALLGEKLPHLKDIASTYKIDDELKGEVNSLSADNEDELVEVMKNAIISMIDSYEDLDETTRNKLKEENLAVF